LIPTFGGSIPPGPARLFAELGLFNYSALEQCTVGKTVLFRCFQRVVDGMHHHLGSHDPVLVALSVLIAALSSYTALDLATRMRAASGSASLGWLGAAAVAMGGGIWSMHFVAMLAFSLPGVDISYDPLLTLLSLAIPILVAAAAFVVVSRRSNALVISGI
jgi:NO-binding membrane sensor protein with MHYT domain